MKETWKITNELLNKRSKSTKITFLKEGDVEIQGKREISNTMNFCLMGEELAEMIDESFYPILRGNYTVNESNLSFLYHEINQQHIGDPIDKNI